MCICVLLFVVVVVDMVRDGLDWGGEGMKERQTHGHTDTEGS